MSVACLVKFVQGAIVGTPGQATLGSTGTSVQVSNGASASGIVTWTFTVIAVPNGSAIPLGVAQTGSTTTWSFTPDVVGCFIIEVTVSDSLGNTASDVRAFGILTTSGRLIPSFTGDNNSLNFGGQTTGWDKYMEQWLLALEALIDGGLSTTLMISASSGSKQITITGPGEQGVALDMSGGTFTALMPTSTQGVRDNQVVSLEDLTSAKTCVWGSGTPGKWSVPTGYSIEDPKIPGVIQAGPYTVTAPTGSAQLNGQTFRYRYYLALTTWKLT